MKRSVCFLFIFLCFYLRAQDVVINEVLYDPAGSDGGYEWIELYNNSNEDVDLAGWKIEKAGSNFETVLIFDLLTFNHIAPHSHFLIGEEFVPDIDLMADLSFQNGGSATDGIRLVSPDTLYTDTVLYDSPNSNNLPDDVSCPATNFAVDVSSGNSLARKQDGNDTDNCELDFFECEDSTPGSANFYPIDLAIFDIQITLDSGEYWLHTEVFNLSTENVDNFSSSLEITINTTFYASYDLPAIPAESSISFLCNLGQLEDDYNVTAAEVIYLYDNNLQNNLASNSILIGTSQILINEIMFRPDNGNQEWLEIFNRGNCGYLVDNWKIIDASGGEISFSGVLEPNDFLVICEDTNLMFQVYPEIDPNKVIQSTDWTSLNNTEESLTFKDNYDVMFDSLSYNGSNCPANFSLERVNPYEDENIEWKICLDSLGTPTQQNSVLPIARDIALTFLEIWQEDNQIYHELKLMNCGLENIDLALLNCSILEYPEGSLQEIYTEEIVILDSMQIVFSTSLPAEGYYGYFYEIYSEDDLDENNNLDNSFFNRSSLPFVVNEIMYAPTNDLPEWLEIKQNYSILEMENFYLVVDEDTLSLPFFQAEFAIITSSAADADTLQKIYNLEDNDIFTGLPSLSNNGEQIILLDQCKNLIESLYYYPCWNDDLVGISIERVNSFLPAFESNWGPSVNTCTPAAENSIFIEIIPSKLKLKADPNPFSPFQGEHTIFNYELPEVISKMTLRIFDLKGRMVCKLVNQQLMSAEGGIVWNGRGKDNVKLPIGVYVVLMQATSRESEKIYEKKTTIVIAK